MPNYESQEEVRRVCEELGIGDWTALGEAGVSSADAAVIQAQVGAEAEEVSTEEFRRGLEVELEHGLMFPDANVTNNHPVLTGKIVLAHLKETLDYYARLEVAEIEGDLLKALRAGDSGKLAQKYRKLLEARAELSASEAPGAGASD